MIDSSVRSCCETFVDKYMEHLALKSLYVPFFFVIILSLCKYHSWKWHQKSLEFHDPFNQGIFGSPIIICKHVINVPLNIPAWTRVVFPFQPCLTEKFPWRMNTSFSKCPSLLVLVVHTTGCRENQIVAHNCPPTYSIVFPSMYIQGIYLL